MNEPPETRPFVFLRKEKRQDKIHYLNTFSCDMQHAKACFGVSSFMLLWFSCHEAAEIHTVTYICVCMHAVYFAEKPRIPLKGQRHLFGDRELYLSITLVAPQRDLMEIIIHCTPMTHFFCA